MSVGCMRDDTFVVCWQQLAHDAFRVAQSLDPAFISCWIGQVKLLFDTGELFYLYSLFDCTLDR